MSTMTAFDSAMKELYTKTPVGGYVAHLTYRGGGVVDNKYASWNAETSLNFGPIGPWYAPPAPAVPKEPNTQPDPVPAKCSKCQEPFPYEAHESGRCYKCRNGK